MILSSFSDSEKTVLLACMKLRKWWNNWLYNQNREDMSTKITLDRYLTEGEYLLNLFLQYVIDFMIQLKRKLTIAIYFHPTHTNRPMLKHRSYGKR